MTVSKTFWTRSAKTKFNTFAIAEAIRQQYGEITVVTHLTWAEEGGWYQHVFLGEKK